jgi:hypothetical protein
MREVFERMPRSRIALETGMHSPWVSRVLSELGHEVIVAHPRNVRLIGERRRKDDRFDGGIYHREQMATGVDCVSLARSNTQLHPAPPAKVLRSLIWELRHRFIFPRPVRSPPRL